MTKMPTQVQRPNGIVNAQETKAQLVAEINARNKDLQIAEEKYYVLQKELAHITRVSTMGQLAASIAHELNQPLGAITSNAQAAKRFLANDSTDLAEVQAALQDISEDGKRAGEVIRRLRALVEKKPVQYKSLAIGELVNDVITLLKSEIAFHAVSTSINFPVGLPNIFGDRVELQQVFLNLILNACEAMRQADVTDRHLRIRSYDTGHETVMVSIEDSGVGIDTAIMGQLFEPFFTTKSGGMGMGLAINKTILESHGGRMYCKNQESGKGALFEVLLPIAEE
jgi:C4-dicarboxylate-specific signal transduction histidine kinase